MRIGIPNTNGSIPQTSSSVEEAVQRYEREKYQTESLLLQRKKALVKELTTNVFE